MKALDTLKEYMIITIGSIIGASSVFFFMVPSGLAIGSVSGIAIVLSYFLPLPLSAISLILNVLFLLLGFLLIGNEFGIKTVYTSLLVPLVIRILEVVFPDCQSITGDPLLDAVGFCVVAGIGQSILFMNNASSGGLDIAAKILNKYLHIDIGAALSATGVVVALFSILCNTPKIVVISLIGTYLNGIVVDKIIFGINEKKKICIISDKLEEIRQYVVYELHSETMLYNAYGAYGQKEPHVEMQIIANKTEYKRIAKFVLEIDPHAFMSVYTVNNVTNIPKEKPVEVS